MVANFCDFDSDCGDGYICVGGRCVPDEIDPPGPPTLPGLGIYLQQRYTANGAVTEEIPARDFLNDVLYPTSRMFESMNDKGQIALKNKKPVPFAIATAAASIGATSVSVDNVRDWISNTGNLLLISPNTNQSEIGTVSGAAYSSSQNSVTLSSTGGLFSLSGFAGCNGANTPATAAITVTGLGSPPVQCTIVVNGVTIEFTTSSSDTVETIAGYIAGVIATHPALNRKFDVSWVSGFATHTFLGTIADTNATFDRVTIPDHGYNNGTAVTLTTTGHLPNGLSTGTTYYIIRYDGDTFAFAATLDDALAGAPRVNIGTSLSSGVQTIIPALAAAATVTITARFGTLTLSSGLIAALPTPLADPTTAPTLTASGSGSSLLAGQYGVALSAYNANGETLLSYYKLITITAGQNIAVSSYSIPAGAVGIKWYVSPQPASAYLRYHSTQTVAAGFNITSCPLLSAALPPDLNRTGAEVMRVSAAFTDRSLNRVSNLSASNVIVSTFKWFLGQRTDSINRIKLKWRDASQDYRLVESRYRDDVHIAKVKKTSDEEVNGQFINNRDQADRIGAGLLAEKRTADFFYSWEATRTAMLLQEGDVVAITDDGSGVVNLPVIIEEIEYNIATCSLPTVSFTARLYASTLYDDSIVEHEISVIAEN